MEGWIKIHRKITEWEWYSDPITKSVFFDLLLTANHEPRRYKGHDILIGQTISGYPAMAKRLGISVQNARTAINHLKSTGELTVQSTNRFSIITLLNYTKYQLTQNETNQQTNSPANSQLTVNQQSTNNTQELKNIRIKENTNMSKEDFARFWEIYPNRKNRQKAEEKFLKLDKSFLPAILNGLQKQINSEDWLKDGGKFIPHPTTWLNGERWKDEVKNTTLSLMNINL